MQPSAHPNLEFSGMKQDVGKHYGVTGSESARKKQNRGPQTSLTFRQAVRGESGLQWLDLN